MASERNEVAARPFLYRVRQTTRARYIAYSDHTEFDITLKIKMAVQIGKCLKNNLHPPRTVLLKHILSYDLWQGI